MKILLVTRHHVVRDVVGFVAEGVGVELEVVERMEDLQGRSVDVLLVDDYGDNIDIFLGLHPKHRSIKTAVLYHNETGQHALFDAAIKKPFLPADIQKVLEGFSGLQGLPYEMDEQILDMRDIDEIKQMLEEESVETISEVSPAEEAPAKETPIEVPDSMYLSEKKKKRKKRKKQQVKPTQEENLLAILQTMKPKKIRKLLKGAEVTISIQFPKRSK